MPSNHRTIDSSNHRFMQVALQLAQRNLGQTWPNPSVGAVIVKDSQIVGIGYTARGGRPHAEPQAIAQAGEKARTATLYVTLEPCAHHGKTPPCVQAIINAGIAKVIVACRDPNPKVNGQGIAQLQAAGIEVVEGVCAGEAREINRGFFSVIEKKRPYVALKIATSLDGKIAYPPSPSLPPSGRGSRSPLPRSGGGLGRGPWITSERARAYGHLLRSRYDAIATGIGTVLADDPLLTCRLPGLEDRSPVRVLFDRQGRLPPESKLVKTSDTIPLWIMGRHPRAGGDLGPHAVQLQIPAQGGDDNLKQSVELLAKKGVTRLLVEAGAQLTTAFLRSGLVDRIYWFRAPLVIGDGGLSATNDDFPDPLAHWRLTHHISLQPDFLDIYECSPASSAA